MGGSAADIFEMAAQEKSVSKPEPNYILWYGHGGKNVLKYSVVSELKLMTSPNIMPLNLGKRNLHWCTLSAAVSRQLITTCACANLSNKYKSQYHVLFRVQQHTTTVGI